MTLAEPAPMATHQLQRFKKTSWDQVSVQIASESSQRAFSKAQGIKPEVCLSVRLSLSDSNETLKLTRGPTALRKDT